MRIYILADLEGTAGVVDFESQTYSSGKYYEMAKELVTEEINAACKGALEAGAKEIVVLDGHGPGGIVPEKIHPEIKLIQGRPLPVTFLLEQGWDCVFLMGHHAMNGTEKGNLNHTESSRSIVKMLLNGKEIGEIGIAFYLAGHFNIPVSLISGDEAACIEATMYNPDVEKAVVKWGITRTSAVSLSPAKARQVIRKAAANALRKTPNIKPVKMEGSCELIIEFISSSDAFYRQYKTGIDSLNPRTIRIKGASFIDVWKGYFS